MSNVIHPNKASFDELLTNNEIVFVDFFASWCGPCKMLAPEIEKLADEFQGKIPVAKVDIDEQSELASRYGIMSIPTLIVFKKGQPLHTTMGYQPYAKIKAMLDSSM